MALKPLEILNTIVFRGKTVTSKGKEKADVAWYDSDSNEVVVTRHNVRHVNEKTKLEEDIEENIEENIEEFLKNKDSQLKEVF